jgi:hypothetical protein
MAKTISWITVLMLPFFVFGGCDCSGGGNRSTVAGNAYKDQLFGLSISKPASWEFITAEESRERISSTKLEDESIEKLVMLFASRPIVSIIKSRRQIPLPNVPITVNPDERSPDISAIDVLRRLSGKGPNAFKDYSIIDRPKEIEIDGHGAAYMKAHYTGEFHGDTTVYPTSYETWIVPRQGYFFMISAVSSQSEDGKTRGEIASIIESIELQ